MLLPRQNDSSMKNQSHASNHTRMKQAIPFLLVIMGLCFIAPYDLAINQRLYDPDHIMALFFERIAWIPMAVFIPISFYALYRIHAQKRYVLCFMISMMVVVTDIAKYWYPLSNGLFICILFSWLSAWLMHLALRRITIVRWQRYEPFFRYVLAVFLSAMLITFLIKQCWGRVRFREMNGHFDMFTPWYQINGMNGHHSFPSAHTCTMSVMLCFWQAKRFQSHMTKAKYLGNLFLVIAVVLMMWMRMVAGAHFFSDVLIGFAITYTMILFWQRRWRKEGDHGAT